MSACCRKSPRAAKISNVSTSPRTLSRAPPQATASLVSRKSPGKLAHVFQYALNAPLGDDLHGPLTEFLSDGISLLENSLLEISDTGQENREDISAFKERYRFAFPPEPPPLNLSMTQPPPPTIVETGATRAYAHANRLDRFLFRRASVRR